VSTDRRLDGHRHVTSCWIILYLRSGQCRAGQGERRTLTRNTKKGVKRAEAGQSGVE
jgi:hypothetical protein